MRNKAKSLLDKIGSKDSTFYAKIRALSKLSENPDTRSIDYDNKQSPVISKNKKSNLAKIMKGTEEVGKSPTEEGGKWKELKIFSRVKQDIPKELSLYSLSKNSPTEFKKYFRDAETGRTDMQAKREQSKAAMPTSAKSMIQKYLKIKNG